MFDIHKVSDKYKILYLKEGVKNKFLTLLLIGLDDQYMNTDLDTLNNSSNYYKKNLNQKIKLAFGENFSVKSKGHLDALSEICGVNFIIKNLTSNENKYASKIYGKTLYFVNKGNEYGLVLKSNKKSLKAELTDGTLSAFEKLSLEGGLANNSSDEVNNTSSEGSETSNDQSIVSASSYGSVSKSQPSSSESKQDTQQPPQPQDNILKTLLNSKTDDKVKDCLYNCYLNELTKEYKIYFNEKLNDMVNKKIEEFEKFNITFDKILEYIMNKLNPEINNNYSEVNAMQRGEKVSRSPLPEELDRDEHTRFGIKKIKKIDISEDFFRDKLGEYNDNKDDIIDKLKKNVIFNVELDMMYRKYDYHEEDDKDDDEENDEDDDEENDEEDDEEDNEEDENIIYDEVNAMQRGEIVSRSPLPAELDRDTNIEHTSFGEKNRDISKDFFRDKLGEYNDNKFVKGGVNSDYSNFVEGGVAKTIGKGKASNKNKAAAKKMEAAKKMKAAKEVKAVDIHPDDYKDYIDNLTIPDLLERGIDSFHDFADSQGKDGNLGDYRREILEIFNPPGIDEHYSFLDKDRKLIGYDDNGKDNGDVVEVNSQLTTITKVIYNKYNSLICEPYIQQPQFLTALTLQSLQFVPRVSRLKNIRSKYNPFDKSWEAKSNLLYLGGRINNSGDNSNSGINLFEKINDQYDQKYLLIFSDANKGSNIAFSSFFSNIDFNYPDHVYNSIDNYVSKLPPDQAESYWKTLQTYYTKIIDQPKNFSGYEKGQKNKFKFSFYNFLRETVIMPNLISSTDKFHFITPASLIDGFGNSTYESMTDLTSVLNKINMKIANPKGLAQFPYNFKIPCIYGQNQGPMVGGVFYLVEHPSDKNSEKYYKLMATTNINGQLIFVDILNETYKDHFNKISISNSRTSTNKKLTEQGMIAKYEGIEFYEIKFDMYLSENITGKVSIIIRMKYVKLTTNPLPTREKVIDFDLPFENLGEINRLTSAIKLTFKNRDNKIKNFKTAPEYEKIYDFLLLYRNDTKSGKNGLFEFFEFNEINQIFLKILFTFKMIGDHGQVKFIKTLKMITEFKERFEVLFTSEDSLALLYANVNEITNMTLREMNFPSQEFCNSNPRGMVYYPPQPQPQQPTPTAYFTSPPSYPPQPQPQQPTPTAYFTSPPSYPPQQQQQQNWLSWLFG